MQKDLQSIVHLEETMAENIECRYGFIYRLYNEKDRATRNNNQKNYRSYYGNV
jgi:hypothetical protein